jgi:hypothetical protein
MGSIASGSADPSSISRASVCTGKIILLQRIVQMSYVFAFYNIEANLLPEVEIREEKPF